MSMSRSASRATRTWSMIRDSIALIAERKGEVLFDAEHFFDGYKANPDYALQCLLAAYDAGARWIVLCDTNGGTLPDEVESIVRAVAETIPGDQPRHPRPQRHRERRRQLAGRGARRRAAGAGHAERPGRALRQRQPRLADPDADAEDGLRDRHLRRGPAPAHARLAPAGRAAEPRAQPARSLCRRKRLRPQGRPACLGGREGPAQLRAHRARRRSATAGHIVVSDQAGRVQHPRALPRDRHRDRRQGRPKDHDAGRSGEAPRV